MLEKLQSIQKLYNHPHVFATKQYILDHPKQIVCWTVFTIFLYRYIKRTNIQQFTKKMTKLIDFSRGVINKHEDRWLSLTKNTKYTFKNFADFPGSIVLFPIYFICFYLYHIPVYCYHKLIKNKKYTIPFIVTKEESWHTNVILMILWWQLATMLTIRVFYIRNHMPNENVLKRLGLDVLDLLVHILTNIPHRR